MGNPAKLQDRVPVIIDLMPCREAGGGWMNTSNVSGSIRFATWNIGTMSGRSAEVVETLPFLSPNQQCQSTEGKPVGG